MSLITSLIATNKKTTLYCPLGVGKHYDHLQVFNIIQKNYKKLQKHFEIKFYAESPYLSYKNNLENRKLKTMVFRTQYKRIQKRTKFRTN